MNHYIFGSFRPKTKTINITLINGGVGDQVGALTAIDYILRRYPWITPMIWLPDIVKSLAVNLLPEGTYVKSYTEMAALYHPDKTTKSTQWDGHTSAMKIHCVDYAFLRLCDELPPIEEKNYLRLKPKGIDLEKFYLPKKYVVITTGFTADVKEFLPEHVNKIVDWLQAKNIGIVFLGSSEAPTGGYQPIRASFREEINFAKGVNLVDRTSLLEAAGVMNGALAVVGVDNGLIHVAGTTEVPIVAGYTFITPESKMPIRNNQLGWNVYPIIPEVECRFCQVETNFLYGHDYRKCLWRGVDESKINQCTKEMKAEKFMAALEKIL